MDSTSLAGIKEQLQKEQVQIRSQADKLRSELQSIDENLHRIDAAIAALEGSATATRPSKAGPAKERKRNSNPAANKADVVQYMEQLLREKGKMPEQQLKEAVQEKLKAAGYTLMGFSLRFNEAKGDGRFSATADGVALKGSTSAGSKGK